jgi:hypothetical protein
VTDYCEACRPTRRESLPSFVTPIEWPGTVHRSDCPTLPQMSRQAKADLQVTLREMERARLRALANAPRVIVA